MTEHIEFDLATYRLLDALEAAYAYMRESADREIDLIRKQFGSGSAENLNPPSEAFHRPAMVFLLVLDSYGYEIRRSKSVAPPPAADGAE